MGSRTHMMEKTFRDPGTEYRGVTLWMLNDKLEKQEILRQLDGFREAGWGAVICRTFNGLRTEYLSEEWVEIVQEIIGRAKKLGLKVWLQAGYMPSAIPELSEDEQHKVIIRKGKTEASVKNESLLLKGDYFYYARRLEHVLDLLNPKACASYLNKAYTDPLCSAYGEEFGKTVETVWVDEPHFKPPLMPWTEELAERFEEKWGYPLIPNLPLLFAAEDEHAPESDYRKVRHHYWRTVLEMFLSAYFEPVSRWCEEHSLKFAGHLMGEDTLRSQISWTGACMPCYEYMQLPGIDHLTLSLTWPADINFILPPKQCSSAANQLGRREKLAEMYAVSSQGITFEDRKWIGDWMLMLGINYRCYHGSFYSMRGRRKRIYVPHLSHQQPWWSSNRLIADYFARLSYVMRQGKYRAEVLVLHPVESACCLYDPASIKNVHNRVDEPEDIRRLNDNLVLLSENLLKAHRDFEYGDEHLIAKHGMIRDGNFIVGEMGYRAVILPPLLTLRETTYTLLKELVDEGGILLYIDDPPSRIDGFIDQRVEDLYQKARCIENHAQAIKQALSEIIPADVVIESTDGEDPGQIWLHQRQIDEMRVLLLFNPTRDKSIHIELKASSPGNLEYWDLRSGQIKPIVQKRKGETLTTRLSFPPVTSHMLFLKDQAPSADGEWKASRAFQLSENYTITRSTPNAFTMDFCRFRRGGGDWSDVLPITAVQEILAGESYAGTVNLQFSFHSEILPGSAQLVVEDAEEYEISVNGHRARYRGLPFYVDRCLHPINITEHIRTGINVVELTREFQTPSEATFQLGSLFHTATGVELEAVYLIGDFGVYGKISSRERQLRCRRYEPGFMIAEEKETTSGDLVHDGYPFFAGTLTLGNILDLPLPEKDEKAFLMLPSVNTVLARLRINGRDAGAFAYPPYEAEITPFIQKGKNAIQLELVNSLRNLLGPHHRPSGEPSQTWSDGWTGLATPERRDTDLVTGSDWYRRRQSEDVFWTDDYFFLPLGIPQAPIVEYRLKD